MTDRRYALRVIAVKEETADAMSVSFAIPDGAEAEFAYKAGQFLTLAVPHGETAVAARCYSLSSSPHDGGPLTITVKRTTAGYASNWICNHLREGSTIQALPPSGTFTPTNLDADLLLFAGGSGITPIMSITRAALSRGSGRIALFYANRDDESVIFAAELTALAAEFPDRLVVVHWLESVQGLPTRDQVKRFTEPFVSYDAFVCGPAPFMKLTTAALRQLGYPPERRRQEKFISLRGNPFGDPEQALVEREQPGSSLQSQVRLEVELDGQTYAYDDWPSTTTLLEHLESKGVTAPYSCREGNCSTCAVRLLKGEVKMLNNDVLDGDDLADGIRLACQSLPVTDIVHATYD